MPTELSGVRKAAVLLLSLEHEHAAELLARIPSDAAEQVRAEIASLGRITPEVRREVLDEFCRLAEGGAVSELSDFSPPMPAFGSQSPDTSFSFLLDIDSGGIARFIAAERPQTIALVLARLPAEKASAILEHLPPQKQVEVVNHVTDAENAHPDAVREIERAMRQVLHVGHAGSARLGGSEQHQTLRELDRDDVALALVSAGQELRQQIMQNLSAEEAAAVQQHMSCIGPVRLGDVESARQRVIEAIERSQGSR